MIRGTHVLESQDMGQLAGCEHIVNVGVRRGVKCRLGCGIGPVVATCFLGYVQDTLALCGRQRPYIG